MIYNFKADGDLTQQLWVNPQCLENPILSLIKDVYDNIFPLGDASKYAHLVFKCIDKEDTGIIKHLKIIIS